jgi:hypothetical protein
MASGGVASPRLARPGYDRWWKADIEMRVAHRVRKGNLMSEIDTALVARLIATQFPDWSDLPVLPVETGCCDNRMFHLGDRMVVRLPSAEAYAVQVEKERRWLPNLAPALPLTIPDPVGFGRPDLGFPWAMVGVPMDRRRETQA